MISMPSTLGITISFTTMWGLKRTNVVMKRRGSLSVCESQVLGDTLDQHKDQLLVINSKNTCH